MARIPDEELANLKHAVSLERLAEAQGIKLKKHGQDRIGCCPFHEDKTPSLVITPSKNLFHCFGCGAAGDVIAWVQKIEGVSFKHAVELLRHDYQPLAAKENQQPSAASSPPKRATTRKLDNPLPSDADNQALLQRVVNYYHECLKQNPEALEYLQQRGLHDEALITRFKLGVANRTLAYRLPKKNRKAGAEIRNQLQTIGILRESGHEHFNGCLVIPVINEQGVITEVYGRKLLGNRLRKGTAQHLYLPGPHQGVWNSEALRHHDEIILCESLIDAMTFWVNGFKNVTTSYGTAGFTQEHLAVFKQHNVKRVLIAYDRDEAGNTASDKLAKQLTQAGIDCFRLLFPKGMDANDYACKVQPARKSLSLVVRKAEWMGDAQGCASVAGGRKPGATQGKSPAITTSMPVDVDVTEKPATSQKAAKDKKCEDGPSSLAADPPQPEATPEPADVSPLPTHKPVTVDAEVSDNEITITLGNRRYRVRGLDKAMSYDVLKVNLLVNNDHGLHVDSFDLYNARHRQGFIKQAASELSEQEEVIKKDIGKVLLKLEALQDQQIKDTLSPKEAVINLNDEEHAEALHRLQDPNLLSRILDDFTRAGVVGEQTNTLVGYLAAVSRKLDNPLAVIIQSTSAAGKSSLMNAVLAMMPEEERIQYSAMTGQSLFYMGETDLKHKILAIAEEEGAEQASYALKLLQSEGELTIASTGKDSNGNLVTQEYRVEGPVMLFSTTTAIDIDEELLNRCIVLSVNESREQTKLIHELQRQRETLEGLLLNEDRQHILQCHRNAQRLLKPVKVVNPYAKQLTFIDHQTRTRRDHMKYLSLMKSIAVLHQYQREVKRINHNGKDLEYIEVTLDDIKLANQLAHEVLGRTLDELPPQTRNLLQQIYTMVKTHCDAHAIEQCDYHFSRKQLREVTGWGDTQLKVHLARLVDMEYVIAHHSGRGKAYHYELLYAGEGHDGQRFMMHLIDVDNLPYDANRSGSNASRSGSGRPSVGGQSADGQTLESASKPDDSGASSHLYRIDVQSAPLANNNGASHHTNKAYPLAAKGR
jgi:DNA primase